MTCLAVQVETREYVRQLAESSKRLEKLTMVLVVLTITLIVETGLLLALSVHI